MSAPLERPGPLWAWEWSRRWVAAGAARAALRALVHDLAKELRPLLVTAADHLYTVRLLLFAQGTVPSFRDVAADEHPLARVMWAVNASLNGAAGVGAAEVYQALADLAARAERGTGEPPYSAPVEGIQEARKRGEAHAGRRVRAGHASDRAPATITKRGT
jgi:hypothetical protein